MKFLILSPEKNWQHITEDLKGLLNPEFEIIQFPLLAKVPREEYKQGLWGVSRSYIKALTKLYIIYKADVILFHFPNFEREGAGGWFSIVNGTPVIQAYGNHKREYTRTGEFKYWLAELIAHEMAHKYYKKVKLKDRTHYWHYEKKELKGAFKEIRDKLDKKLTLLERVKELTRILDKQHEEELVKELYCFHHSATPLLTTKAETIINNSIKDYGKSFYDIVIDKEGIVFTPEAIVKERGTIDVCVIGDFTKDIPTRKQIEEVNKIIKGNDYTSHKELARIGLATPSLCPGFLMGFVENYDKL